MSSRRPPRLVHTCYVGFNRYLLTVCTFGRSPVLSSVDCFELVKRHLLQSSGLCGFAVLAYCCMPDHLHMLVEGLAGDSDLEVFIKDFKQRSSYERKRMAAQVLWQDGYHDRVLRDEEHTEAVARYLLANPVRAGFVDHPLKWPYLGSERYRLPDLLASIERSRA